MKENRFTDFNDKQYFVRVYVSQEMYLKLHEIEMRTGQRKSKTCRQLLELVTPELNDMLNMARTFEED